MLETGQTPPTADPAGGHATSFGQERFYFLQQQEPTSTILNRVLRFRLTGRIDAAALETSLRTVITRHVPLRTALVLDGSGLTPKLLDPAHFALHEATATPEVPADVLVRSHADHPFRLEHDFPLRSLLVHESDTRKQLLICIHHTAADGSSDRILLQELSRLYNSAVSGTPITLPELAYSYTDFAAEQRSARMQARTAKHLDYWRQQLAGLERSEIIAERSPESAQRGKAAECSTLIPADVFLGLQELARSERATPFMVVATITQMLIGRLSGESDVAIGSTVANRTRPQHEALVGCFMNTVVLRAQLDDDEAFRPFLRRNSRAILEAVSRQETPFEAVVAALNPERHSTKSPFFQLVVNMIDRGRQESLTLGGLSVTSLAQPEAHAQTELLLELNLTADGLELHLFYQSDLFAAASMELFLQQLTLLLRQAVDSPDRQLKDFALIDAGQETLLPDPRQELAHVHYTPIQLRFHECVRAYPGHPAVEWGTQAWTYAELDSSVRALMGVLQALELPRGAVVALSGERSYAMVALSLAAMGAGLVMMPVEASLPQGRLEAMFKQAQVQGAIFVGEPPPAWTSSLATHVRLVVDPATCEVRTNEKVQPQNPGTPQAVTPSEPAYIFFTSGSTGVPKGILGRHNGLAHGIEWYSSQCDIHLGDRYAYLMSMSFDASLRDIFAPLTSGATLVIPPPGLEVTDPGIVDWAAEERITLLAMTPSLARLWLQGSGDLPPVHALRMTAFTGEPLTDTLVTRWRTLFPGARILNLYGPTETTLIKCFYDVPSRPLRGVQPVGYPLPHSQALVLSASGRRCGIGEPGEIILRTPYRSLGYLPAVPEADHARFFPNPWRDDSTDLLYATGDRGCLRTDGRLEILGRLDDQVKVNGVRIELREIEAALEGISGVRAAAAVRVVDQNDNARLVAAVVGANCDVSKLRLALLQRLPQAMVPSAIRVVPALPSLANGKLDRRAVAKLLQDELASVPAETAPEAPSSPLEIALAEIWQEVLNVDSVSRHDDFFELGGHSLLAMRMIAGIESLFGIRIHVSQIFHTPTLAEMAESVLMTFADEQTAQGIAAP